MSFSPATELNNRSYIGLVLSQFLAAFNDQAIHIVAIFYASDMLHGYMQVFDQKLIVSIVTACFISPFFLFSPVAGILADKYSKRRTIIIWKITEIVITGITLIGFLLPHISSWAAADPWAIAGLSATLVIAGVFMMGTHSAFYGPAKYGIMPEMLHASVLSRGNGVLEATSFMSQILGTSFGGFLYYYLKSRIVTNPLPNGSVDQVLMLGSEWIIGSVLFGLAFLGAILSFFVAKVPAAAPERAFTLNPLVPLGKNIAELRRSRPLKLATIGIAFFTFMTLFVRQTLLYQGESNKELNRATHETDRLKKNQQLPKDNEIENKDAPNVGNQWHIASVDENIKFKSTISAAAKRAERNQIDELWVSILVALVGLGVGIRCGMAGRLSGSRLELGLVPIGTMLLILLTATMAFVAKPSQELHGGDADLFGMLSAEVLKNWPMILCLVAIGFSAGLYIVPLYTMLQHRAPKDSKGNMIATSNFMNVTGGLLAIVVFYFSTFLFQELAGNDLKIAEVKKSNELKVHENFVAQLERQQSIPQKLFLVGSGVTALIFVFFIKMRPDFLVRCTSFVLSSKRRSLRAVNAEHLPSYGPLLIVSNSRTLEDWINVISVVDRSVKFVCVVNETDRQLLAQLSKIGGVVICGTSTDLEMNKNEVMKSAMKVLLAGDLLGVNSTGINGELTESDYKQLIAEYKEKEPGLDHYHTLRLLPVYCGTWPLVDEEEHDASSGLFSTSMRDTSVVVGSEMDSATPWPEVLKELEKLGK